MPQLQGVAAPLCLLASGLLSLAAGEPSAPGKPYVAYCFDVQSAAHCDGSKGTLFDAANNAARGTTVTDVSTLPDDLISGFYVHFTTAADADGAGVADNSASEYCIQAKAAGEANWTDSCEAAQNRQVLVGAAGNSVQTVLTKRFTCTAAAECTPLASNTGYQVRVTAYNAGSTTFGPASEVSDGCPYTAAQVPAVGGCDADGLGFPTLPQYTGYPIASAAQTETEAGSGVLKTDGSISFTYSLPSGPQAITGVQLFYKSSSDGDFTGAAVVAATRAQCGLATDVANPCVFTLDGQEKDGHQITLTGFTKTNFAYKFALKASNVMGTSPSSDFTADYLLTAPMGVAAPTITGRTSNSFDISWARANVADADGNIGSHSLTEYKIYASQDSGDFELLSTVAYSAADPAPVVATLTGFPENTQWSFKVATHNDPTKGFGVSPMSAATANQMTKFGMAPEPVTAEALGQKRVKVTWTTAGNADALTSTRVLMRKADEATYIMFPAGTAAGYLGDGTEAIVEGLEAATTYFVKIQQQNDAGWGATTNNDDDSKVVTTGPAPQWVADASFTGGSTIVAWAGEPIENAAPMKVEVDPEDGDSTVFNFSWKPQTGTTWPDGLDVKIVGWSEAGETTNWQTAQLRWTPTSAQAGDHTVCIKAKDNGGLFSADRCITITVKIPVPSLSIKKVVNLVTGETEAHTAGTTYTDYVDCGTTLKLSATDGNVGHPDYAEGGYRVKVPLDLITVHNSQTGLTTIGDLPRATMTGTQPAHDAELEYKWTPIQGEEGITYTVCFKVQDEFSSVTSDAYCVTIKVDKCMKCLLEGETLTTIGAAYDIKPLSLFSINHYGNDGDHVTSLAYTKNPDVDRDVIHIGLTYTIKDGDSLQTIADLLGTKSTQITRFNPDMIDPAGQFFIVEGGNDVCVPAGISTYNECPLPEQQPNPCTCGFFDSGAPIQRANDGVPNRLCEDVCDDPER